MKRANGKARVYLAARMQPTISGFLKRSIGQCGADRRRRPDQSRTARQTIRKDRMKESGDWLDRTMSFLATLLLCGFVCVIGWAATESFTSIRLGIGGSRGAVA